VSSNYGSGSNGDDLAINISDGITTIDGGKAIDVGLNEWHFVVVRIRRGDTMSLLRSYKGSYLLQEDDISSLTGSLSSNLKIRIGTSHEECAASFTKMDMDDLGIWSRALSAEEVESIWMAGRKNGYNLLEAYDSPNTHKSEHLGPIIAMYDFENDLVDSSSNNLDMALIQDGGGMSFNQSIAGSSISMSLNHVDFQEKTFVTLPTSSLLDFGEDQAFTM